MPLLPLLAGIHDSLHRVFPSQPAVSERRHTILLARGERQSFQVVMSWPQPSALEVEVTVETPPGLTCRIRRLGLVPVPTLNTGTPPDELDGIGHLPGMVPDPLFDETRAILSPWCTQSFWCTLQAAPDAPAGKHPVTVQIRAVKGGKPRKLRLDAEVAPVTLQARRDFPVMQWFYCDALLDFYQCQPFDEAFWTILERYLRNCAEHFQDGVLVPAFTPPTDGIKRPTQLLRVKRTGPDQYHFDWSDVARYIKLAQACGIRYFEWNHLFTQWGCRHAIRIYEDARTSFELLWPPETPCAGPVYRAFLGQFLPQLKAFCETHGILNRSFFHVSDEPHLEHLANYQEARNLLRELAPWMKITDALSNVEFALTGATDLPIPVISSVPEFQRHGVSAGAYFCCGPRGRYLNRLMDTPLAKIRMGGCLLYKLEAKLFLHWGYNYWYKSQTRELIDPYRVSDGLKWPGWAHGDTFCVYPGPQGPVDSLRWEVFAEGLQDYALLQTLGLAPGDPRLAKLVDYQDFPKDGTWLKRLRRQLLSRPAAG